MVFGLGISGFGFMVFGLGISGFGFRVSSVGLRVWELYLRVKD
jgi:hypothetical protein